jgi:hypothetical protein
VGQAARAGSPLAFRKALALQCAPRYREDRGTGMSRVVKKRRKKMRKHKYKKLRKKLRHKRK